MAKKAKEYFGEAKSSKKVKSAKTEKEAPKRKYTRRKGTKRKYTRRAPTGTVQVAVPAHLALQVGILIGQQQAQ